MFTVLPCLRYHAIVEAWVQHVVSEELLARLLVLLYILLNWVILLISSHLHLRSGIPNRKQNYVSLLLPWNFIECSEMIYIRAIFSKLQIMPW